MNQFHFDYGPKIYIWYYKEEKKKLMQNYEQFLGIFRQRRTRDKTKTIKRFSDSKQAYLTTTNSIDFSYIYIIHHNLLFSQSVGSFLSIFWFSIRLCSITSTLLAVYTSIYILSLFFSEIGKVACVQTDPKFIYSFWHGRNYSLSKCQN